MPVRSVAAAGAACGMFMGNLGGIHLLPDLFFDIVEILAAQNGLFRLFFLSQSEFALLAG